jgi:hypothetical protein
VTPDEIVGLLAEPDRLRVVAALTLGHRALADLTAATGLDARAVGRALRRLESGGLVTSGPDGPELRAEVFKTAARGEPRETGDPFLRDGRLLRLPARFERRRAVLEQVATSFEPGRKFPERQVDEVLIALCEGGRVDHVTLRRYLVDAGLLGREAGVYWRTGGPV